MFSMIGAGLDSSAQVTAQMAEFAEPLEELFRKCAVQLDGARWVWVRGEAAEWPWLMRVFRRNHERWDENHFGGQ